MEIKVDLNVGITVADMELNCPEVGMVNLEMEAAKKAMFALIDFYASKGCTCKAAPDNDGWLFQQDGYTVAYVYTIFHA